MKWIVGVSIALVGSLSWSKAPVISGDDLRYSHPGLQEKLNAIWNFSSGNLAQLDTEKLEAPQVHLEPFTRAQQSPQWTAWQNEWIVKNADVWLEWTQIPGHTRADITQDWVRAHLSEIYPFPASFRGFHYEGSNHLQVNPETTYMAFYQTGPFGLPKDMVGYGYYVTGHEMTHYALSQRGIPDTLHHCIYITEPSNGSPSLMQRMTDFLVDREISSFSVDRYGLQQEIVLNPCAMLSATDRAKALRYAEELSQAPSSATRKK